MATRRSSLALTPLLLLLLALFNPATAIPLHRRCMHKTAVGVNPGAVGGEHAEKGGNMNAEAEGGEGEIDFGYDAIDGPLNWGKFSKTCDEGTNQSPIDLTNTSLRTDRNLKYTFGDLTGPIKIVNNGHGIEVEIPESASPAPMLVAADGQQYQLRQFHFHTPSEHRLNGQHFPLETHFVMSDPTDTKFTVVGLFWDLSPTNTPHPFLDQIVPALAKLQQPKTETELESLSFTPVLPTLESNPVWAYSGSLTTPPCAEGLLFHVIDTRAEMSVEQWKKMKEVIGFNARPVKVNLNPDPGF